MKKIVFMILGWIGVAFGMLGAILPMLPAFPFLMFAAFCFTKSSEKLDAWFKNTKLYKENLEDFVSGKGMSRRAKIRIMSMVTALMSIGFIMMSIKGVFVGNVILIFVWIFHILYFSFGIKTRKGESI